MLLRSLACVVVATVCFSSVAFAQTQVGLSAGWLTGQGTSGVIAGDGPSDCVCPPIDHNDYVRGVDVGLLASHGLWTPGGIRFDAVGMLTHTSVQARWSVAGDGLPGVTPENDIVYIPTTHHAAVNVQTIGLGIGGSIAIDAGLRFTAVVRFDMPLTATISQSVAIPDSATYQPAFWPSEFVAEDHAVFTRYNKDLPDPSVPMVSFEPSLSWAIPIDSFAVEPFVAVRLPFGDLDRTEKIRITLFQAGLRLTFRL